MIVDCAVYEDGERRAGDLDLDQAARAACDERPGFVWLGVHEPTAEEFDAVRREFNLHELAVEDPAVLLVILVISGTLYRWSRRSGWL